MEVKVNILNEEETVRTSRVFSVETPDKLSYKAKYGVTQLEELEKQVKKQIKDALTWEHLVHESVWGKMKITIPKTVEVYPQLFDSLPDVLAAMSAALIKDQEWHKIKREQLKLDESTKETPRRKAVKPKK